MKYPYILLFVVLIGCFKRDGLPSEHVIAGLYIFGMLTYLPLSRVRVSLGYTSLALILSSASLPYFQYNTLDVVQLLRFAGFFGFLYILASSPPGHNISRRSTKILCYVVPLLWSFVYVLQGPDGLRHQLSGFYGPDSILNPTYLSCLTVALFAISPSRITLLSALGYLFLSFNRTGILAFSLLVLRLTPRQTFVLCSLVTLVVCFAAPYLPESLILVSGGRPIIWSSYLDLVWNHPFYPFMQVPTRLDLLQGLISEKITSYKDVSLALFGGGGHTSAHNDYLFVLTYFKIPFTALLCYGAYRFMRSRAISLDSCSSRTSRLLVVFFGTLLTDNSITYLMWAPLFAYSMGLESIKEPSLPAVQCKDKHYDS